MDGYSALTSWAIFGTVLAAGAYYYWPKAQRRPDRYREDASHANGGKRRRNEHDVRTRQAKQQDSSPAVGEDEVRSTMAEPRQAGEVTKKRKASRPEQPVSPSPPEVRVVADEPEEVDMNTRQWAQQMVQTRKGHDIGTAKSSQQRVKTVKQSSATNTPILSSGSSQAGAEADDDLSPVASPSFNAGDVSDMLEPVAPGPMTLRVTAPTGPQRGKVARQPKEEFVETKKQRQNRKKVEEKRQLREQEEKERKALEEKQRRAAREARGEPARNGIPGSRPPTVNVWTAPPPAQDAPLIVNGSNAPLLDTFDAESISSSNGGMGASTGPTSTTSGGAAQWDHDLPSEEEQMAQAMKQSEDESGWTTVAAPAKKQKKATAVADEGATDLKPALSDKTNGQQTTPKPATNGKPKGFQGLEVQYEQRADADPNDASNWDA